jgi:hypothetical protein
VTTQAPNLKPGWAGQANKAISNARAQLDDQLVNTTRSDQSILKAGTDLVGFATVSGELKIKALTKDNDIDPRRVASGKVWNQAQIEARVGAGSEYLRAGQTITARAILPTDLGASDATFNGVLQSFGQNAKKLAAGMPRGFDADAPFRAAEVGTLPPGAELSVKFNDTLSVGVGKSVGGRTGVINASASVGVADTITREVARSVYKMPDGSVYAEVGETAANTFGVNAELSAGVELNGTTGKLLNNPLDSQVGVDGDAGASTTTEAPFTLGGVFDLSKPDHRKVYTELMTTKPLALKAHRDDIMKRMASAGVGFEYSAQKRAEELHAHVRFGSTNVLSFSRVSKTEDGKLLIAAHDGSGTKEIDGSQVIYDKSYGGSLPMFLLGKNGSTHVSAMQLTRDGKTESYGMLSTTIEVDKLDPGMLSRTRNVLTSLGVDTTAAKVDSAIGDKAHLEVEFAMTKPFFDTVQALGDRKATVVQALFDKNYRIINGHRAPWRDHTPYMSTLDHVAPTSVAKEFAEAMRQDAQADSNDGRAEYKRFYTLCTQTQATPKGRNFDEDKAAYVSRNSVATQLAQASGKASDWQPLLDAVGGAKDRNFLIIAMSAHELGAPLVSLSATAHGVVFKATPNLAARPQTLENAVGLLTSRWNP